MSLYYHKSRIES